MYSRELRSWLHTAAGSRVIPTCTFYVCYKGTKQNCVAPAIKPAEARAISLCICTQGTLRSLLLRRVQWAQVKECPKDTWDK